MRKYVVSLAMAAAAMTVILAQAASAQPGAPGPAGAAAGIGKAQILTSINRAELTVEQLQALAQLTQTTIDAHAAVAQAQAEFETFLVGWAGSAEEFETALQAEQQKVQAAVDALQAVKQANLQTIKDMLTASQFEALERALMPLMGQPGPDGANGPARGAGDRADEAEGPSRQGDRGPGRDGGARMGNPGESNALGVLLEALNEKIAALQG